MGPLHGWAIAKRIEQISQDLLVPIVRGRAFADADRNKQSVVILSESAAQILFRGKDPIGHTVETLGGMQAEVVGVAREIRNTGPTHESEPELYALWRHGSDSSRGEFFSLYAFYAIRAARGL